MTYSFRSYCNNCRCYYDLSLVHMKLCPCHMEIFRIGRIYRRCMRSDLWPTIFIAVLQHPLLRV